MSAHGDMGCGAGQGVCRRQATLGPLLTAEQRQALAAAMLEDVLAALAEAPLAGIMVNTVDPLATELGATVWRTRRHRWRARWPHRRSHCDGAHACRRGARNVDRARRHPARDRGRDRRGCRGRPTGPLCHHCAGARRTRVKRCTLLAATGHAAALRRRQFPTAPCLGARPWYRTYDPQAAWHRAGHRSARGRARFDAGKAAYANTCATVIARSVATKQSRCQCVSGTRLLRYARNDTGRRPGGV